MEKISLENELKNLDIHAVYGMEWLKKNGYSQKKNQELVRRNPFLPYALILTRQEMEKLGRNGKNICTSFPVPIVEREKLEEVQEKYADKIVRFPGISFYILFNENLLDEENTGIQVYIGNESPIQTMKDCSVVTATYELGEGVRGTIGIVGPKRMDYEKVMANLNTLKKSLDGILDKPKGEV